MPLLLVSIYLLNLKKLCKEKQYYSVETMIKTNNQKHV